jgi:hypothetical protein
MSRQGWSNDNDFSSADSIAAFKLSNQSLKEGCPNLLNYLLSSQNAVTNSSANASLSLKPVTIKIVYFMFFLF